MGNILEGMSMKSALASFTSILMHSNPKQSTFKRIKIEQPSLSMTQINKLVAAEWAEVKAKKALQTAGPALLANQLGGLAI